MVGAPAPGGCTVGRNSESSSVQSTVEGSASEPSSAHHVSRREGAELVTSGVEDSCDTRFRHSFLIHKYYYYNYNNNNYYYYYYHHHQHRHLRFLLPSWWCANSDLFTRIRKTTINLNA